MDLEEELQSTLLESQYFERQMEKVDNLAEDSQQ